MHYVRILYYQVIMWVEDEVGGGGSGGGGGGCSGGGLGGRGVQLQCGQDQGGDQAECLHSRLNTSIAKAHLAPLVSQLMYYSSTW
jgi:hypothetical protein